MNNIDLEKKIKQITHSLVYEKGYVCAVDMLMRLGYLAKEHHEDWRFGRIPYLEKVCNVNLSKLSLISKLTRKFANELKLKPSFTVYKKYGKGAKPILIFSKTRLPHIEETYATHYVDLKRINEINIKKAVAKNDLPPPEDIKNVSPVNVD